MRFFVSHIFDGVIMDGYHYDTIEDEKNNKSHLLFCKFGAILRLMVIYFFISKTLKEHGKIDHLRHD